MKLVRNAWLILFYTFESFIKFFKIYIDIFYPDTYNEYMSNRSNEKIKSIIKINMHIQRGKWQERKFYGRKC